jgi:DNA polymerase III alpha subunit
VVSTDASLVDSLPLRSSDEAQMITQFEMADLET